MANVNIKWQKIAGEKVVFSGDLDGDGRTDEISEMRFEVIERTGPVDEVDEYSTTGAQLTIRFGVSKINVGDVFTTYAVKFGGDGSKENRIEFYPPGGRTRVLRLLAILTEIESGNVTEELIEELSGLLTFPLTSIYKDKDRSLFHEIILRTNLATRAFDLAIDQSKSLSDIGRDKLFQLSALIFQKEKDRIPTSAILESKIVEKSVDLLETILKERSALLELARRGPDKEGKPFFDWAWRKPVNEYADEIGLDRIDFEKIMHLYHYGGFPVIKILEAIGTSNHDDIRTVFRKKGAIGTLFRLATMPAPLNAHVSLSADSMKAVGNIISEDPKYYNKELHTPDEELGVSIHEFALINSGHKDRVDVCNPLVAIYLQGCNLFWNFTDNKKKHAYISAIMSIPTEYD